MSGKSVPNGPCSNDVEELEGDAEPCKPILEDTDDEPPLSTQEMDFDQANSLADGAVDANRDADAAANTANDADATIDTAVEETQTDTAEGAAADNSSNPNAHIDTDKEGMSSSYKAVDAGDSTETEVELAAVDTDGEDSNTLSNPVTAIDSEEDVSETVVDTTKENAAGGSDNDADVVTVDNTSDGAAAADSVVNPNTATDTAEDSKAVVDNTTADTKNDADADANGMDLITGDADNSNNPNAEIKTDEEQKAEGGDTSAVAVGADANHDEVDDTDEEQKSGTEENTDEAHDANKNPEAVVVFNTDEAAKIDGGNEDSTVDWNALAAEAQKDEVPGASSVTSGTVKDDTTTDGTAGGNLDEGANTVESSQAASGASDVGIASEGASYTKEVPQTLYTSPDSTTTKPADAVKVLLKFDYDLTTASSFDSETLYVLEDKVAKDLAGIYGLIATSTSRRMASKRRHLRKLTEDDIMALDSNPVDVNVANAYECKDNDPNLYCTPITGFMTAYLVPGSDVEAIKAAIISNVEQGMESRTYLNNEIIKTSFIGTRSGRDDTTTAILSLEQQKALSGDESSVVIGLSVFFLGFAALVGYFVFQNHKKKRRSNNSESSTAQMSRNTIGVDFVEIASRSAPAIDKYDNNVGSTTASSSGDEEDLKFEDIKYGITEDYGDLIGTLNKQDITQVHPKSCLAVIESCSDLDEISSFDTGAPRTSPRNNVPADSNMPDVMSPLSTTAINKFRSGMISPSNSMGSNSGESDRDMLDNESVY